MSNDEDTSQPKSSNERMVCAIVMPISATENHTAAHWSAVLTLIKRAIGEAGYEPNEAWVAPNMDLISDRILTTLVNAPLAVCDVTDHNPNVMFELGLRLSTSKPTIIIMEEGTRLPFDIKDFGAISYPEHLSILETESFLQTLAVALKAKMAAYQAGTYQPFSKRLEGMEVLSPAEKEVPFNMFIADTLHNLMMRLEYIQALFFNRVPSFEIIEPNAPTSKGTGQGAAEAALGWRIHVPVAQASIAHSLLLAEYGEKKVSSPIVKQKYAIIDVEHPAGPVVTRFLQERGIQADIGRMKIPP